LLRTVGVCRIMCFKPSKDRYKLRSSFSCSSPFKMFQTLKGSLQTRPNLLSEEKETGFKPSKDRYKLLLTPNYTPEIIRFKPSKDRYKRGVNTSVRRRRCGVSNPQRIATNSEFCTPFSISLRSFKPSKDRYKPMFNYGSAVSTTRFQTLKGSLQTELRNNC